ncbi:MAG: TadE family protein [Pseudomonadota bacterium]
MRSFASHLQRFKESTGGAILVEALIVVPVVTILAVGILEFGNVFWERQQMQSGVRDAARYWSRCNRSDAFTKGNPACDIATARNIAFYGNPDGTGNLRVPGWSDEDELNIYWVRDNTILAAQPVNPTRDDLVVVDGELDYFGSPLFGMLQIDPIVVTYRHTQRYIQW